MRASANVSLIRWQPPLLRLRLSPEAPAHTSPYISPGTPHTHSSPHLRISATKYTVSNHPHTKTTMSTRTFLSSGVMAAHSRASCFRISPAAKCLKSPEARRSFEKCMKGVKGRGTWRSSLILLSLIGRLRSFVSSFNRRRAEFASLIRRGLCDCTHAL